MIRGNHPDSARMGVCIAVIAENSQVFEALFALMTCEVPACATTPSDQEVRKIGVLKSVPRQHVVTVMIKPHAAERVEKGQGVRRFRPYTCAMFGWFSASGTSETRD